MTGVLAAGTVGRSQLQPQPNHGRAGVGAFIWHLHVNVWSVAWRSSVTSVLGSDLYFWIWPYLFIYLFSQLYCCCFKNQSQQASWEGGASHPGQFKQPFTFTSMFSSKCTINRIPNLSFFGRDRTSDLFTVRQKHHSYFWCLQSSNQNPLTSASLPKTHWASGSPLGSLVHSSCFFAHAMLFWGISPFHYSLSWLKTETFEFLNILLKFCSVQTPVLASVLGSWPGTDSEFLKMKVSADGLMWNQDINHSVWKPESGPRVGSFPTFTSQERGKLLPNETFLKEELTRYDVTTQHTDLKHTHTHTERGLLEVCLAEYWLYCRFLFLLSC